MCSVICSGDFPVTANFLLKQKISRFAPSSMNFLVTNSVVERISGLVGGAGFAKVPKAMTHGHSAGQKGADPKKMLGQNGRVVGGLDSRRAPKKWGMDMKQTPWIFRIDMNF